MKAALGAKIKVAENVAVFIFLSCREGYA